VIAERVLHRLAEQDGLWRRTAAAVDPTAARVAGRAVLLIPHRGGTGDEAALPADYRKILAIVRAADGPVQIRAVCEELGLEVTVRGKLSESAPVGNDPPPRHPVRVHCERNPRRSNLTLLAIMITELHAVLLVIAVGAVQATDVETLGVGPPKMPVRSPVLRQDRVVDGATIIHVVYHADVDGAVDRVVDVAQQRGAADAGVAVRVGAAIIANAAIIVTAIAAARFLILLNLIWSPL